MEKSESIKNIAEAMSKFQSEMEAITKDATNPFFKSKYASLSAIIEDTRAPLGKNGLSYAQFPKGESELTTILMHKTGEWMSETYLMKPVDQKPQSVGSAMTYMRRYALCAVLGLQVDDDDGNGASGKASKGPGKVIHVPLEPGEEIDTIQVLGTDTDEPAKPVAKPWKKPTANEQKATIMKLVDGIVMNPLPKTKEAYEGYVLEQTGLILTAGNYEQIIERLSALQKHETVG